MSMSSWSPEFEQELTPLLKDWLKHQGRTQADLRRSLRAISTRMPAILEVLEREFRLNGLSGLASKLCQVEREWQEEDGSTSSSAEPAPSDPFSQLDLLLQEIRDDCPN
jgi:hypothetical protein